MPTRRPVAAAVLGLGLALAGSVAANDSASPGRMAPTGDPPEGPDTLEIGAALFAQFCAGCHGPEARGDGPLAGLITAEMPDLTRLAAANDGTFPMLEVVHMIDGRTRLAAHGGPMPVWGAVFQEPAQLRSMGLYGSVLEARGRIMALTLYLETLQE